MKANDNSCNLHVSSEDFSHVYNNDVSAVLDSGIHAVLSSNIDESQLCVDDWSFPIIPPPKEFLGLEQEDSNSFFNSYIRPVKMEYTCVLQDSSIQQNVINTVDNDIFIEGHEMDFGHVPLADAL